MKKTAILIFLFSSISLGQVGISIYPEGDFLPVATIVNKNISQFQKCYKNYLNSGGKEYGDVILKWDIADGKVLKGAIVQDEIKNSQMNTCLLDQLKKTDFSSLGKDKKVKVDGFPLSFKRRYN